MIQPRLIASKRTLKEEATRVVPSVLQSSSGAFGVQSSATLVTVKDRINSVLPAYEHGPHVDISEQRSSGVHHPYTPTK